MELRQLEYFVAVAEEANFTRAAERVHISQSGVSAQVRQLELDLGAALIDRSGRTATLTAAGAAALEHARAVLASVEAVRHAVDDVTGLIRGRLVVGMVYGCTIAGWFDALAGFHLSHPGVEVTLIEASSDPLTEHIRTGTADIALVGTAGAPPPGLDVWSIASERLVAAVPVAHPLARQNTTMLADLGMSPIVCMPEGTAPRTMFDRACEVRGIRPDVALQASAPDAVADLAIRGLGVAILTESMAARHADRLRALVIEDVEDAAGLALIWSRTKSPALQAFLLHAYEAFAGSSAASGRPGEA